MTVIAVLAIAGMAMFVWLYFAVVIDRHRVEAMHKASLEHEQAVRLQLLAEQSARAGLALELDDMRRRAKTAEDYAYTADALAVDLRAQLDGLRVEHGKAVRGSES